MKRTAKQMKFVEEILVDGYGDRAAIRAGYSPKSPSSSASRMLRDPEMVIAVLEAAVARRQRGGRLKKRVQSVLLKLAGRVDVPGMGKAFRRPVKEARRSLGRLHVPAARGKTSRAKAAAPRLPDDPPPEQFGVFAKLLPRARYKGAYGGRGSGKSHFFAELLVRRCLKGPVRAVCIREVQRSLDQSVKRLIEDKIQVLGVGDRFTVQQEQILTPGGRIIFQGMQNHTAESIKSLEVEDHDNHAVEGCGGAAIIAR